LELLDQQASEKQVTSVLDEIVIKELKSGVTELILKAWWSIAKKDGLKLCPSASARMNAQQSRFGQISNTHNN
jgi:hypothetical protein